MDRGCQLTVGLDQPIDGDRSDRRVACRVGLNHDLVEVGSEG